MVWDVPDRAFSLGYGLLAGDSDVAQKRVIKVGQGDALPVQGMGGMYPVQQANWPRTMGSVRGGGGVVDQGAGGHRFSFRLAFCFVIWMI
jgi:hypothetical protein